MGDFPWLREAPTPVLADLGNRIADCIVKHGYTEQSWLISSVKRQIEATGIGRICLRLERDADGKWKPGKWVPA